ncbi:FadR/GntR family transcriptional regulator [Oricola sp.]|uniref:FadR/GntR family transcriptional regulator n=1 Tax=Oricola sp. TaxID=1979950 RepID=UPI003BA906C3
MSSNPFQFDTLKRAPLSFQVANKIRERIESGEIEPSAQLPSERELSESFSVSRVAIREAIQLLQAQRFVEVRHGKGTYVVEPAVRSASSLDSWIGQREEALRMMVELRKIVEPGIAELAARKATPERAARLIELARRLETAPPETLSQTDADFHREIAAITENTLVDELLRSCLDRTEPLRLRTLRDTSGRDLAASGHLAIAQAIAAGDPDAARLAMEAHMNDALRSI